MVYNLLLWVKVKESNPNLIIAGSHVSQSQRLEVLLVSHFDFGNAVLFIHFILISGLIIFIM
jgi:hypothetical protein